MGWVEEQKYIRTRRCYLSQPQMPVLAGQLLLGSHWAVVCRTDGPERSQGETEKGEWGGFLSRNTWIGAEIQLLLLVLGWRQKLTGPGSDTIRAGGQACVLQPCLPLTSSRNLSLDVL